MYNLSIVGFRPNSFLTTFEILLMIKKILPLAISAALATSFAAPAMAYTGDVTIYGKMHVSMDYFKSDSDNQNNDISDVQVSSNSSRIGFKGSEDLGGGLKAIWQVESGVNLNNQQGNTWSTRNSFLGLSGGWGTVIAGKHDTPVKIISRKLDVFGDTIFDTRAMMGTTATGANRFNLRTSNTVAYISPSWSGFSVIGAYVADAADNSSAPNDNDRQAFSGSATYANGPLYAAIGYEWHKGAIGGDSMIRGGASYKFGAFKLGGMLEKGKSGNGSDAGAGFQSIDRWGGNVFGTYDFGNNTAKLQFAYVDDADDLNLEGDNSWMWSVGMDHKFSKRTKVYGAVGQLKQGGNNAYFLGGGHNTNTFNTRTPGEDQTAVSLGMIHTF